MLHLGRPPPLLPHPIQQPHLSQYRPILSIIIFIVLMILSLMETYYENHANTSVDVKKPEPTLSLAQLDARSSLPIPHHSRSSHGDHNTHTSHASSSEKDDSLTLPSLYPFNISALYKGRWISSSNHRMTNTSSGVQFERDEGTIVYRIRSLPIPSQLHDLIYIDGEMIIHDGIYTTNHDLHYILHGMYQPKTGELHVFANWPDWNSKENLKLLNVTGSAVKALNESIMENQNNQVDEHDKRYAPFCVTQMAFRLDTLPPNEASEAEPNSDDPSTDDSDVITDPDNIHLPHRVMNGIIKSDSEPSHCLFRIDVIDASIVRNDIFYAKAINYAIMAGAAALIQIALSKKQMEYAASSSRAAKMSLLTIGQQALLDSYLLLFHLVTGILIDALFSAFMTTAFIQFVIFSIFEMRLMLILWKSRRPDAFNQGWERMRRELSILYMRFYGFLVIGLIIIYQLHALLHYFVFIIYSFWTCQIIFNLIHDTNHALLPSYIIGMSFTRLLIPLYLLICPVNFLNQSPNISVGIGLTCYVIITALILLAQDCWGPRFFVPKAFLPAKYDYHRAIPMVSLPRPGRNGYAPVATVNSINTTPATTTNEATPETVTVPVADDAEEIICAICYCEFDPNARLTDTMVCPCDHYFHTPCLTRWMEQKMECPTCRRALPPV